MDGWMDGGNLTTWGRPTIYCN